MKKHHLTFLLMFCLSLKVVSQTVSGVITQVPCNNDGIYTVTSTGFSFPINYSYYLDNELITHSNVNSATDQLTNIPMGYSGNITVFVDDGVHFASDIDTYTPSFSFSIIGNSPLCPITMGTLNATQNSGSSGPFTFEWTNSQTLNSYSGNNVSVPIGTYSVTIVDQTTGCSFSILDSIGLYQLSNVTATVSSTQANCTNGTATAVASGGISPYTYLWMNGATSPTITGLVQNYYSVIVTDAQGCQSNFLGTYVQQNPTISVNISPTDATCTESDGSAIAFGSGGVSPYTYSWSNGQTGQTATNLSGSINYNVIATDANGCTGTNSVYLSTSTPITVTYTSTVSSCTIPTGSATVTPIGGTAPYTIVWNTSPSVTGATISNFAPGTYSFVVTDAVGCVRTGAAVIDPVSTISASGQGSTVPCPNTIGNAAISVSGSNPPFTYAWSNGATTSQISGVQLGSYSCLITDAVGCKVTKYAYVNSISNLNIGMSTTPVSCLYNTDGSAIAQVTGGTAPYTYSYSNGNTTANATTMGMGCYWLTVSDVNGCSNSTHFTITNAATSTDCYCTIEGNVFLDGNANCTLDGGEVGVENIMIHCSGQGYQFTDVNGNYGFQVPSGTYTIEEQVNGYYPLTSCQPSSTTLTVVAATGCQSTVNIANAINIIHDLKVVPVNSGLPPIPGNSYQQAVIVKNEGTVIESGIQVGYETDGQLPFVNSTMPGFMQTGNPNHYGVQSGFLSLNPNETKVLLMNYNTPTNIPLGTEVSFYDSVAHLAPIDVNWLLDYTPWNNVNHFKTNVIGSYDPNYKEVYPKGNQSQGYISSLVKEFDYTIHFQNEGTYFAANIVVTDQLDEDLDWKTLSPGYSDYSYTTSVSETGLVTFTFANINLPWKSSYGDALSSGLINYSIKRKTTNPQGTEFTNTANIFFDYNAPITTNTTVNTLNDALAGLIENVENENFSNEVTVDVFPMPAKDLMSIRINNVKKDEVANVSIIDLTGNVVSSKKFSLAEGTTLVNQNVSNLATGTYLTKIEFENGSSIIKKIVLY